MVVVDVGVLGSGLDEATIGSLFADAEVAIGTGLAERRAARPVVEVREEESNEELMLLRVRILTETVSGWSRGSLDCSRTKQTDGWVGDGLDGQSGSWESTEPGAKLLLVGRHGSGGTKF